MLRVDRYALAGGAMSIFGLIVVSLVPPKKIKKIGFRLAGCLAAVCRLCWETTRSEVVKRPTPPSPIRPRWPRSELAPLWPQWVRACIETPLPLPLTRRIFLLLLFSSLFFLVLFFPFFSSCSSVRSGVLVVCCGVLVLCWWCAGSVLVVCWWCVGCVLVV